MDVYLSGRRHRVSDAELLGEGGEARVYRLGDRALKLFHPATDAASRRAREDKVGKLRRFPLGLPPAVIAPQELATDRAGEVLGYVMPLVEGAEEFSRLASRRWREGVVPNERLARLFGALHLVLQQLHRGQVVVGDLNDGNALWVGDAAFLIDADSLQFGPFPCPVGHERFLDPRLYGVDLAAAPRFTPGSDWYAFAVMLFSSLLAVHPFGGTHPARPTLLRRAEARHSVLRGDVTLPRQAVPFSVLPDDLAHWFHAVFEHDTRGEFPPGLLAARWTRCPCGLEHARAACPACHTLGPLLTRPVLRARGRCAARTAFQTSGRVLAATLQGGLRYVYEEGGVVRREDGSLVQGSPAALNQVFAVHGASTWVAGPTGSLTRMKAGRAVERAATGLRHTTPVLCATSSVAWRVEQGWLIELSSGARVGQVLEGQTWLWAGERRALGLYRVGGLTVGFLVRPGRPGLKQLAHLGWHGRLVEAEAVFDASHALLSVVTASGGVETAHRWLFDDAGDLLASSSGGPRGRAALLDGRVVLGTDAGLISLRREGRALVEGPGFPDTQPFVSAGDELLPNPDGSITVVGARDILQLTLT